MVFDDDTSGRSRAPHPEQKGVVWMKEVIGELTFPEQTILYLCTGTFATAKPCMLLPRNRFLFWVRNAHCLFQRITFGVLEQFAGQILNEEYYIVRDADVQAAEKFLMFAVDGIGA